MMFIKEKNNDYAWNIALTLQNTHPEYELMIVYDEDNLILVGSEKTLYAVNQPVYYNTCDETPSDGGQVA